MNVCELRGIDKSFGNRKLFCGFTLTVEQNEMVCITGRSGSGKSTLLNMIGMFEKPDGGSIRIFGKELPGIHSEAGRRLMRDHIFYLFQNYALVEDQTVSYNLEIPLMGCRRPKKEKERWKAAALSRVGLDVNMKEKIFHLSGGEQQRVAIARGYLRKFDLLLADEPTGSLDGNNRNEILAIMKQFQEMGKTVIIVSHDPYVMEQCQRVVSIEGMGE